MTEEEQKKPGRPALDEVYCIASLVKTSKGVFHHGDRVKLPKDEAAVLKAKRFVQ